jgi:hypothetical protein
MQNYAALAVSPVSGNAFDWRERGRRSVRDKRTDSTRQRSSTRERGRRQRSRSRDSRHSGHRSHSHNSRAGITGGYRRSDSNNSNLRGTWWRPNAAAPTHATATSTAAVKLYTSNSERRGGSGRRIEQHTSNNNRVSGGRLDTLSHSGPKADSNEIEKKFEKYLKARPTLFETSYARTVEVSEHLYTNVMLL